MHFPYDISQIWLIPVKLIYRREVEGLDLLHRKLLIHKAFNFQFRDLLRSQ